jgi:hypothetical protein
MASNDKQQQLAETELTKFNPEDCKALKSDKIADWQDASGH